MQEQSNDAVLLVSCTCTSGSTTRPLGLEIWALALRAVRRQVVVAIAMFLLYYRGASGEELPVLSVLYNQVVRWNWRLLVPFVTPVAFPDITSKNCEVEG